MQPRPWRAQCVAMFVAMTISAVAGAQPQDDPWIEEVRPPLYFAVYVSDMDKSVDWYSSVFGLRKLGGSAAEDDAWRIENLGDEQLLVELIKDARVTEGGRMLGFRKVGFYVEDLEAVAQRVTAETGEEARILEFEKLRQRILQLRDPDGNTVQLFSPMQEH